MWWEAPSTKTDAPRFLDEEEAAVEPESVMSYSYSASTSYSYSASTDTDGCNVHSECGANEYCMDTMTDTDTCGHCTDCCNDPETSFDNLCPDSCHCETETTAPSATPVVPDTGAPSGVAPPEPDTGAPSVVVPDTDAPSVVVPVTDAPSVVVPVTDAPSVSPDAPAPAPAPVEKETSAPTWDTADTVETVSVTFKGEFALGGMDSESIPEAGSDAAVELEATIKAALAASLDGIDTSMIKIIGYEMVFERRKLRSLAAGSLKVIFEVTVIVPAAHENTYATSVKAAITEAVTTGALVENVIAASEGTAMATALAEITISADSLKVETEVTPVVLDDDMGEVDAGASALELGCSAAVAIVGFLVM